MENLFTGLLSPWSYASSGMSCAGPHAAARNTCWNLPGAAGEVENKPTDNWGFIQTNLVGVLAIPERLTSDEKWYGHVDNLQPENLYTAQLAWRKANETFSGKAAFIPADDAANVAVDADLKITFNETVKKAAGRITIKSSAETKVFNVSDAAVTVSDNVVAIDPGPLDPGTEYYILVEYGAFKNTAGNLYTGLNKKEAWDFMTVDD